MNFNEKCVDCIHQLTCEEGEIMTSPSCFCDQEVFERKLENTPLEYFDFNFSKEKLDFYREILMEISNVSSAKISILKRHFFALYNDYIRNGKKDEYSLLRIYFERKEDDWFAVFVYGDNIDGNFNVQYSEKISLTLGDSDIF